jgi:hypothetical protein
MADLLTLEEARNQFAKTEPLQAVSFQTFQEGERKAPRAIYGEKWRFRAEDADPTEPVPVWLEVPELNRRFQLTFQAAQQLGSTCRIPQDLQVSIPAEHCQTLVNWFLAEGLGERPLKLLLAGMGEDEHGGGVPLAVAQTRATVTPFSNMALLDQVCQAIASQFGKEAAATAQAHFTLHHDLEHTDIRVVVPGAAQDVAGDPYAPVVEFTNSCIGLKQTTVTGALMRMESGGVMLDTAHSAGGFKRLQSTPEMAYDWTAESAKDVLEALQMAYANVARLATTPVGDHMGTYVSSLCGEFRIPKNLVTLIDTLLEESDEDLTMLTLAADVARLANMSGLKWRAVQQMMSMAGHVVHAVGARCSKDRPCYRALPADFDPEAE